MSKEYIHDLQVGFGVVKFQLGYSPRIGHKTRMLGMFTCRKSYNIFQQKGVYWHISTPQKK